MTAPCWFCGEPVEPPAVCVCGATVTGREQRGFSIRGPLGWLPKPGSRVLISEFHGTGDRESVGTRFPRRRSWSMGHDG